MWLLVAAAWAQDVVPVPSAGVEPSSDPRPAEVGPSAAASRGQIVDRVAAVVNNDVVALSQVYELGGEFITKRCPGVEPGCVLSAELEVLDTSIRRVLVRQELQRLQIEVTEAEIDGTIDNLVASYQLADRQALRTEVEASGKRWDQYRSDIAESLRTRKFQANVLAPRITVTEDEVRDLYQRTARSVSRPVVRLSGLGIPIPVETPADDQQKITEQANVLVDMLNGGQLQWDEAVKRYDGGAAGMFAGQEFDEDTIIDPLRVVFSGEVGVVQAPVRVSNPGGVDVLFILRVDEKMAKTRAAAFEDVRAELENQVFQQKLTDAEEEWYQRARREAAIQIKLS